MNHPDARGFDRDTLESYAFRGGAPAAYFIEAQVLGAIIAGHFPMADAVAVLHPRHFADPLHGMIFAAMGDGSESPAGLHELCQRFDGTGELDAVGGSAYLRQICVTAAANLENDVTADVEAILNAWADREARIAVAATIARQDT